jgi:hypothetical protein
MRGYFKTMREERARCLLFIITRLTPQVSGLFDTSRP